MRNAVDGLFTRPGVDRTHDNNYIYGIRNLIVVLSECYQRMLDSHRKVTIKIPRMLYDNLSVIIKDSGFNSVTDFIVYVLRDLASSREVREDPSLTKEEIEHIKKRLRSLGYL